MNDILNAIKSNTNAWLVTGAAGFIGSHLVEELLRANQKVVGLDNFSTGFKQNLDKIESAVSSSQWKNFCFIEADIADLAACQYACENVDYILHQAALASVPASMDDPIKAHDVNVTGFINILTAARDQGVRRVVYASSSAVYGEGKELPKTEEKISDPISPYAANKYMNEVYAKTFSHCFGLETVGLRYFNVFGPRQDPNGAYAAVIPKWLEAMLQKKPAYIYGDGESTRDFIFVKDVVRANLLAALTDAPGALNQAYNIGLGNQITLNQLFNLLSELLSEHLHTQQVRAPRYEVAREGDIRHSYANVRKTKELLEFSPKFSLKEGLRENIKWYADKQLERQRKDVISNEASF